MIRRIGDEEIAVVINCEPLGTRKLGRPRLAAVSAEPVTRVAGNETDRAVCRDPENPVLIRTRHVKPAGAIRYQRRWSVDRFYYSGRRRLSEGAPEIACH